MFLNLSNGEVVGCEIGRRTPGLSGEATGNSSATPIAWCASANRGLYLGPQRFRRISVAAYEVIGADVEEGLGCNLDVQRMRCTHAAVNVESIG